MAVKKSTGADIAQSQGAEVSDDAYYAVQVSERFKVSGVGFGTVSVTQVSGTFLKQLLAGEHAPKVTGYTLV